MRALTSQARPSAETAAPSESCAVVAHGFAEATVSELPQFRQKVGPVNGPPLTNSFIRHMDDQTMVGLAAVFAALHKIGRAHV